MEIAILMGGLQFDSQQEIVKSIWRQAREDGNNIYIFLCDIGLKALYNEGEFNIFNLPDLKRYDGIIFLEDTIQNMKIRKQIIQRIRVSAVPCICMNSASDDMTSVKLDNAKAMERLVLHLIETHGVKTVNFISGPRGNFDSAERMRAVETTMERFGLELKKERIYYGNYQPESGKRAIQFFEHSEMAGPDAYICANDEMALGAFSQLQEYGIKVPEDMILTGFDNIFAAKNHIPRITSVERGNQTTGNVLYKNMIRMIRHEKCERHTLVNCIPVFAESCGCALSRIENDQKICREYSNIRIEQNLHMIMIRNSLTEFMGLDSFGELKRCIQKYIRQMDPEGFFLCLNDSEKVFSGKIKKQNTGRTIAMTADYADKLGIPIAYVDHKFQSYIEVERGNILPDNYLQERTGTLYIIKPLHYLNKCYGYCVISNSELSIESQFYHMFIMNICDAMENIRKQEVLISMLEHMRKMWIYDTLTGVYNRAGFDQYSSSVIRDAQEKGKELILIFLDLDNLKRVNDRLGHDEGDQFICIVADILKKYPENKVVMRYGGDEFVILGSGTSEDQAKKMIRQIKAEMENYNTEHELAYRIDASMGYCMVESSTKENIENLIRYADEKMYEEKRLKCDCRKRE